MPKTPKKNPFLNAVPAEYKQSLVDRMTELESLWNKLNYGDWNSPDCKTMHRTVHNIRGSSALFKHNEIVEVAMRMEMQLFNHLDSVQAPNFDVRELLEQQLKTLHVAVKKVFNQLEIIKSEEVEDTPIIPKPISKNPLVYIVDDDPIQLKHLEQQMTPHNYRIKGFTRLSQLTQAFKQQLPDAIVADIVFPEDILAGIKTISRLTKAHKDDIPVIYISSRVDLATRLAAKRAGGVSYLTKPVNIPSLLHKLEEFLHQTDPFRVMIVDDDEIAANMHSLVLKHHHIVTHVITDIDELMPALNDFNPELILMDYRLPDCTGLELMELIRGELKYASLPIYVISGEISKLHQEEILNAGADDFLLKPVKTKLLVSMVRNRIKRERSRSWGVNFSDHQDPITGLYNRSFFLQRLSYSLDTNHSSQSAVLQIKIDRFVEVNNILGLKSSNLLLEEISELIQALLAPKDLLSRYSESSFALLGERQDRQDFIVLGQTILTGIKALSTERLGHDLSISCSIGIGVCWSTSAQNLMANIEQLTQEASQEGGNTVHLSSYFNSLLEDKGSKTDLLNQLISNIKHKKLQLKYQPIVSSLHDETPRYEVLLNFVDEQGLSLPTRPLTRLAEKKNIMDKIDVRVMNVAIQAIAGFSKNQQPTLFIKLSSASIINKKMPSHILKYLKGYKVNADKLVFLLPTNSVWQHIDEATFLTKALAKIGCYVGLEYFGRKQSDTQLLERLNIDYVKFAPSVINGVVDNEEKLKALESLIQASQKSKTLSILSFIEDADIMTLAWTLNPDMMQGYFVQPPDKDMHFVFNSEAESTGLFEPLN